MRRKRLDEDELNEWLAEKVDTGPFIALLEVSEGPEVTVTLEYKTGDGVDEPYSSEPPDEGLIRNFERHGWTVKTEGIMRYGFTCEGCKTRFIDHEELNMKEDRTLICPKCYSEKVNEIEGSKWKDAATP